MQFPPYFTAGDATRDYVSLGVRLLAPLRAAVEFRHASWLEQGEAARTLDLLEGLGAAYVCVDEPRLEAANVLPPLAALTSDTAYVRFHGRNAETWNIRTGSAAERFKYLYSMEELSEWVEPVRCLSERASTTYLMFNNCFADYAPRNARQMLSLFEGCEEPRRDP